MLTTFTACGGGGSSSGGGGGGGGQVVSVAISPSTASVIATQSKTFTATVSNSSNTAVTWSVQEGSTAGTITAAGVYTAPSQAGTYHVVATSQADTSKSASAAVTVTAAPAPTFTSTPPTSASQGVELDYIVAATDPAGGTVSFQLTTAPSGATLTGNTMKWTPTVSQSRTSNSFTITATTSEGGSGTQPFSISVPSGTINVTRVFTYHSTDIDGNFITKDVTDMTPFPIAVYVPDGSGSFTTIAATGTGTGHYSATNVPAGYYWFENGASNFVWTSQSSIDAGNDENGRDYSTIAYGTTGTTLDVSLGGASAWQATDIAVVNSPNSLDYLPFASASAGDTTLSSTIDVQNEPLMNQLLGDYVIAYQLVHHTLIGGGYVGVERFFGPKAFTTTTGTSNTLTGSFTQVTTPNSVRLSVKASQFAAFTTSMGPGATNDSTCTFVRALPSTATTGYTGVAGDILLTDDCASGTPTVADEDLGNVAYGNPYPPYASDPNSLDTWPLFAGFVQQVQVPYQLAGTTAPYNAIATNIAYNTTLPTSTSPIAPLVSPVRNPMIGPFGGTATSLSAATITGVGVNPVISWQAPSTGTPTGYTVAIIPLVPSGSPTLITVGLSPVLLWVGGSVNSIQVPPGILTLGDSYAIRITARVANNVDAEKSPFRRSLPFAQSEVLSGVVTP